MYFGTFQVPVILLITLVPNGNSICCHATLNCNTCDDCAPATPFCATGSCNMFGCNCDGVCRTGQLCPIGAVGKRGQVVMDGPNCLLPYDRFQPYCAVRFPGRTGWEFVHACRTRGKRSISNSTSHPLLKNNYDNASHIMHEADQDGDQKLSFNEARGLYDVKENEGKLHVGFAKLDRNEDGYITVDEIDSSDVE